MDVETGRLVSRILVLEGLANAKNRETLKTELKRFFDEGPAKKEKAKPTSLLWQAYPTALQLLDKVGRREGLEIKWPNDLGEDGPNIGSLIDVSRIALLRAYWRFDHGQTKPAAHDLVNVLSFGLLLESAQGGLVNCMVGLAISEIALKHTVQMIPRLNTAELTEIQDLLVSQAARPGYVGPVLAYEQHAQEFMWEKMRHWPVDKLFKKARALTSGKLPKKLASAAAGSISARGFYDADKSIAFSRDYWRRFIRAAKNPPARRVLPTMPNLRGGPEHLKDNPVGRILLSIAMPDFEKYLDREDRLRSYRRMVLLRVTLALYQRSHNRLPLSLNALVPDPLTRLPVDLFAFQRNALKPEASFLYDAKARRLSTSAEAKPASSPTEIRW